MYIAFSFSKYLRFGRYLLFVSNNIVVIILPGCIYAKLSGSSYVRCAWIFYNRHSMMSLGLSLYTMAWIPSRADRGISNGKTWNIRNVFFHWLKPCSVTHINWSICQTRLYTIPRYSISTNCLINTNPVITLGFGVWNNVMLLTHT